MEKLYASHAVSILAWARSKTIVLGPRDARLVIAYCWLFNCRSTVAEEEGLRRCGVLEHAHTQEYARKWTQQCFSLGGFGTLSARQARVARSLRLDINSGAAQQLLEFAIL